MMILRESFDPAVDDPIFQSFHSQYYYWRDPAGGELLGPYGTRRLAELHYKSQMAYLYKRSFEFPG